MRQACVEGKRQAFPVHERKHQGRVCVGINRHGGNQASIIKSGCKHFAFLDFFNGGLGGELYISQASFPGSCTMCQSGLRYRTISMKRACIAGSVLKSPVKRVVSVEASRFCTPRMDMQLWAASTITATPRASS